MPLVILAIGSTTSISPQQLPVPLQGCTTILQPNTDCDRNLIKNQQNLIQLSGEVGRLIDQLSALPDCQRVHLFLSVQSSFDLELGRRFQEVPKNIG
ncbi:SAVED domain-containing protein [Parendozoicomonas callyspongiae]|uniref:SAVED domain-containing protein n=1 Tax=Parendozoicomonas callyspongiae TaxID=2942213 RepID=UPI0038CDA111